MSNSSYLICVGTKRSTKELYAEYSLPDGWAQLFAPDELFRGHPRDHAEAAAVVDPKAVDREISSFLFCKASTGLPRFAERMRRHGHVLTGRGMIARVYAWLEKHMGDGFWYANTTELEWMETSPGEGFGSLKHALAAAADRTYRFTEPSPESLLLTFGWGTGLSAEEKARATERKASKARAKDFKAHSARAAAQAEAAIVVEAARKNPTPVSALAGRPYGIRETFTVGDEIAHPVFQTGTVTAVTQTTITVRFAVGDQLLAHARK
jgi:hypothetical protein